MSKYRFAIDVQFKSSVRDPRGETIEKMLRTEKGLPIYHLRLGKSIHLEVEAKNEVEATRIVHQACEDLLVNPVVEEYEVRTL